MKIKMGGCFQNGKEDQKAFASFEDLSKLFKVHRERGLKITCAV